MPPVLAVITSKGLLGVRLGVWLGARPLPPRAASQAEAMNEGGKVTAH